MRKAAVKKATRKHYEYWFKGEMILSRAILHVQQQYALYPGDFPLGAEGYPHTYLSNARCEIGRERRAAGK